MRNPRYRGPNEEIVLANKTREENCKKIRFAFSTPRKMIRGKSE
jgi:hypothetical protein